MLLRLYLESSCYHRSIPSLCQVHCHDPARSTIRPWLSKKYRMSIHLSPSRDFQKNSLPVSSINRGREGDLSGVGFLRRSRIFPSQEGNLTSVPETYCKNSPERGMKYTQVCTGVILSWSLLSAGVFRRMQGFCLLPRKVS